jgi:glycosyltransferase involved in cell wall biosynthesis
MRLSVHLMVRDGAAVLDRLLRPLRGIVDEVCFVDTGSTDGTPDLLARLAAELKISCRGVAVSPISRPDLYFPDLPSSFLREVPGPHTGLPILRDWSAARNLGLDLCSGRYVLKVDADDEVLDPGNLLALAAHLDVSPQVDFVMSTYEVVDPSTGEVDHVEMYTRLWRRRPEVVFREICHENVDWCRRTVDGTPNWLMAPSGLTFRDHRDSLCTRVPNRNLKVLLREYEAIEAAEGRPTAHLVMYLAHEARRVMPGLAHEVLEWLAPSYQDLSPSDASWYLVVRGEAHEAGGHHDLALESYARSAERGSRRAALLRAMLLWRGGVGGWREVLAASVELNRGCYYPQGASLPELRAAEKLLREGS